MYREFPMVLLLSVILCLHPAKIWSADLHSVKHTANWLIDAGEKWGGNFEHQHALLELWKKLYGVGWMEVEPHEYQQQKAWLGIDNTSLLQSV